MIPGGSLKLSKYLEPTVLWSRFFFPKDPTPRDSSSILKIFKNTRTRRFFDSAEFVSNNQNLRVLHKSSTRPTLDSTKECWWWNVELLDKEKGRPF